MKRVFVFFIILVFISLSVQAQEKVYRVVIIDDWKPYYFLNEDSKPAGYAVELFEEIAKDSNIKFRYIIVHTWKNAHQLIENKKADIIPNIGLIKRRKNTFYFTDATDNFEIGLFKREELKDINSVTDLKNTPVAVVIKNVCEKLITEKTTKLKMTFDSFNNALNALRNGEVDVMCYPKPLMENSLNELGLENQIVQFSEPLLEVRRGIGVSKENKHLVKVFNKSISKLQVNGNLSRLQHKWFESHGDIELSYEQLLIIIFIIILFILITIFILIRKRLIITQIQLQNEIEIQKRELQRQNRIINTQSKIKSIVEMLNNISHQWRQPLATITMSVNNIKLSIELGEKLSDDELSECIDTVTSQSKYLSDTIDDFKQFFDSKSEDKKKLYLIDIISRLESLFIDTFRQNNIKIIKDVENYEFFIKEETLLKSLSSILNNSKDAILQNSIVNEDRFVFISAKKFGKEIVISIKDSGGGIQEDIIESIFDPYFTTKFKSQGKGMGLYITYQLITEDLESKIEVKNSEFYYNGKKLKGAEFIIKSPL